MASQVAGGIFNAFAFAGAGFIFSKLNRTGYAAEIKRHNEAMEELAKAKEKWNEARLRELDRVSKLRESRFEGRKDLDQTNKDFLNVQSKFNDKMPLLSDFYKPGKEMEEYMTLVKFLATFPVLYGAAALVL